MDKRPVGIFDSGIGGLTVAPAFGETNYLTAVENAEQEVAREHNLNSYLFRVLEDSNAALKLFIYDPNTENEQGCERASRRRRYVIEIVKLARAGEIPEDRATAILDRNLPRLDRIGLLGE